VSLTISWINEDDLITVTELTLTQNDREGEHGREPKKEISHQQINNTNSNKP